MTLTCVEWLVLGSLPRLGLVRLAALRQQNPPWPTGWLAHMPTAAATALRLWLDHPKRSPLYASVQNALEWEAAGLDHHLLSPEHPCWPALLEQIADPPAVLWALGDINVLPSPKLAIVGSRRPTREGLLSAKSFASAAAGRGWCIASGMALGIDGVAQQAALDAGGASIAVLPGGVDVIYPPRHAGLYQRLQRENGLIVAERPPGYKPYPGDFPRRNRIVTGLSCGVLVVEAAEQSGSLISARLALEQGREVMALPGSIHAPQSRGCLHLIRQGAALVRDMDDVIEALSGWGPRLGHAAFIERAEDEAADSWGGGTVRASQKDNDEASRHARAMEASSPLLRWLSQTPTPVDVLIELAGCDVATCQRELTQLEMEGLVALVPGGWVRQAA